MKIMNKEASGMDRYNAEQINKDVCLADELITLLGNFSEGDAQVIETGKVIRNEIIKNGPAHPIERAKMKLQIIDLGLMKAQAR